MMALIVNINDIQCHDSEKIKTAEVLIILTSIEIEKIFKFVTL